MKINLSLQSNLDELIDWDFIDIDLLKKSCFNQHIWVVSHEYAREIDFDRDSTENDGE